MIGKTLNLKKVTILYIIAALICTYISITTPKTFATQGKCSNIEYPISHGTFIQRELVKDWGDEMWESEFKYLKEAGMHYIIINASETDKNENTYTYYESNIPGVRKKRGCFDLIDTCLKNAEKFGFKVFIGINYAENWWSKGNITKWLYPHLQFTNKIIDELYNKYYTKYPSSFYGWYWVYEVDNKSFITRKHAKILADGININLNYMKKNGMRLPVMFSPYMNSIYSLPKEYANMWEYVFLNTDLSTGDIFAPQDCIGGGGLTLNNYSQWFRCLRGAVDKKKGIELWANCENFDGENWSSAPVNRYVKQMQGIQKYVDNYITFSYSHYYSPNNISKGYHEAYVKYVNSGIVPHAKPDKPQKVRIHKASGNKYKITWEKKTGDSRTAGYIIFRDGKLVGNSMIQRYCGGKRSNYYTSFYDQIDNIHNKIKIKYDIRAISFDGNMSEPATVEVLSN